MKKQILYLTASCIVFAAGCSRDSNDTTTNSTAKHSHDVATAWMDLELKLVKTTPGFSPPVAARALGYTGLTLYETVVPGMPQNKSAAEAYNYSYTIDVPGNVEDYNWAIAANAAMKHIVHELFANTTAANKTTIDSLYQAMLNQLKVSVEPDIVSQSETFGTDVATAVFDWSKTDNGHEGYNTNYPTGFTVPTGAGAWVPTPPAFQAIPLQPYWGSNRPFVPKNVTGTCLPPVAIPYSEDTGSVCYKQAYEVYTVKQNLTNEQKDIALFWADGGGTISPPGHCMNIGTQIMRSDAVNLAKAAEVYMRLGMALNDAFIACWKGKYMYNVMRPVTYIKKNIDSSWTSLIGTPPFPEYGSGHSTGSGAAAEVLTASFGNRSFTDHTHDAAGMTPRSFSSFHQAAEEAAVSRLYGGIHYRNSNDKALTCGKEIGYNITAVPLSK
jgi:hypothetical protein